MKRNITTQHPPTPTTAQDEAYAAWRDGRVTPGRITLALAYAGLPQQSVANVCGTDAETVDLWERGAEYPSWGQLVDLAAITEEPLEFFLRPVEGPGAMFLVPSAWEGGAEPLRASCCSVAVESATEDVPVTIDGWESAALV